MNNEEINKLLDRVYYQEHNYDGINELYRKAKLINKNIIKEGFSKWLKNQDVHQQANFNKIEILNFKPIYTDGMYDFQIDLTFFKIIIIQLYLQQ